MFRIPGEQDWVKGKIDGSTNGAMSNQGRLPKEVHGKYPLPGTEGNYLGALVKVCTGLIRLDYLS